MPFIHVCDACGHLFTWMEERTTCVSCGHDGVWIFPKFEDALAHSEYIKHPDRPAK